MREINKYNGGKAETYIKNKATRTENEFKEKVHTG